MTLSDIKARHAHIENQERTQSIELLAERRSKSHADRAWLIAELERALEQNRKLEAELDRLGDAVAQIEAKPQKAKASKKATSKEVKRGKGKTETQEA